MMDAETRMQMEQIIREVVSRMNEEQAANEILQSLDELRTEVDNGGYGYGSDAGKGSGNGNFEPTFAPDANDDNAIKLDSVGEGYCPVGRQFYSTVTLDSSAKIAEGVVYLEVNHPTSSSSSPTLYLKGATSGYATLFANSDTNKTNIPLYKIKGGAIVVDYRSAMSMTLREL